MNFAKSTNTFKRALACVITATLLLTACGNGGMEQDGSEEQVTEQTTTAETTAVTTETTTPKAATVPKNTTAPKSTTASIQTEIDFDCTTRFNEVVFNGWTYSNEIGYVGDDIVSRNIIRTRFEGGNEIREVITSLERCVGAYAHSFNVAGNKLYFYSVDYSWGEQRGAVYNVGLDGTNLTKIKDVFIMDMKVSGDWIYYTTVDYSFPHWDEDIGEYDYDGSHLELGLFRMRLDGSGKQKITGSGAFHGHDNGYYSDVTSFAIQGEWIYFVEDRRKICKVRVNGTGLETILDNEWVSSLHIVGDKLFYAGVFYNELGELNWDIDNRIYSLNKDGTNKTAITELGYPWHGGSGFNYRFSIDDGWIYYTHYVDYVKHSDRKVRLDGSENTLIRTYVSGSEPR